MSQIVQTIAEQLKASKVHGFPFFLYTGIKVVGRSGENTLVLQCPRNPRRIKFIWIKLNVMDTYDLELWIPKRNGDVEKIQINDIYADMMSEIIVREMGIQ